jgi:site-specific DNA recombinase
MLRAASMSRVSTDEQNKGNSPDDQINVIRSYAEQNGIEIVAEFREDYSGYEFERPELNRIRALIKERQINALIVRSGDRLARSVMVAGMLAAEFAQFNLELHFVSRGKIDYTSPEGQFIFYMECVGNQYWGAKAKEAMRNGRKAQIAAGIPLGQGLAPYGYRKVGKKRETHLVIYEEEALVVIYIFTRYATDRVGPKKIAEELAAMGKTPPMKAIGIKQNRGAVWTPDMVRRILKNETYTGVYWVNRRGFDENGKDIRLSREHWKALTTEPIIDRELWEEAKSLMARGRSIYAVNKRKNAYLMARRLECTCGKSVVGMTNYRGTPYYRCGSIDSHQRKTGQKCGLPLFRADRVDAAIWKWVERLYNEPETIIEGLRKAQEEAEETNRPVYARINAITAEIERQQKRLTGIARELADTDEDDQHSRAAMKAYQREVLQTIKDAEQQREKAKSHLLPTIPEKQFQSVAAFSARLRRGLEEAKTFEDRLEMIEAINLTGTLMIKNGRQVVKLHWYAPDDDDNDDKTTVCVDSAATSSCARTPHCICSAAWCSAIMARS